MSKYAYDSLPSLRQHVTGRPTKDEADLSAASQTWVDSTIRNKLVYEIDWLGVPIIQTPEDIVLMQELIFRIQPDLIIETGVAHGGSLVLYASIMQLLGRGEVLGIDVDIRPHNRDVIEGHPLSHRISLLQGSSTAPEVVAQAASRAKGKSRVIVCLDSDHTGTHVLSELRAYASLVTVGSYLVVYDTHTDAAATRGLADARYINNGPMTGLKTFLGEDARFAVDPHFNRLRVSYSPDGYVKRLR